MAWLRDRQRHSDHSEQSPVRLFSQNHPVRRGRSEHRRSCNDVCGAGKTTSVSPVGVKPTHPAVARAFVEQMAAYFAEEDGYKRDVTAVRQPARAQAMFHEMKELPKIPPRGH
jgi:hypothetical protein